jgi:hypothetical protein
MWAATSSSATPNRLSGVLAGTRLSLAVRRLRLVRPDVAVADLDLRNSGAPVPPPGANTGPGGEMRTSLMLVLVQEHYLTVITATAEHRGGVMAHVPRTVHACPDYEDNGILDLQAPLLPEMTALS